ncbi:MAG: N-6 DNA methylase [Parvibaculaceae bacterium]|nr:N-6 DNA methylase [Parvibaculaceae bacterium]
MASDLVGGAAPKAECAAAPAVSEWESAAPILQKLLGSYRRKRAASDRLKKCLNLISGKGPTKSVALLQSLSPAWADHAIASIYALLMSNDRRKNLGAYFTPPHLVDHLVSQLQAHGVDVVEHRLRDPAAGGAAFLVPLARLKTAAWRAQKLSDREIVARLQRHLIGREIDRDLATIANALVRRMLVDEFKIDRSLAAKVRLVRVGDSLNPKAAAKDRIDHEVGNPPFLRLKNNDARAKRAIFSEMVSGRLNLYALFVRRALEEVPAEGTVGYVIPASFLGGPEFEAFRRRVLQLAEVLVIDQIEMRDDVFLDAIQDACFIVLRRRTTPVAMPALAQAASGVLHRNGKFSESGTAEIAADGAAWRLPGLEQPQPTTLKEWGYRATIGYLVPNRQPERLHKRSAKGRYPLIWAKSITTEGRLDFDRGAAFKGHGWVDAPSDAPYIIRTPCVAIQRTSSRGQKRRLNAAPIFKSFVARHGGIIAENHVIILRPLHSDAASPRALAAALNQPLASAQLDRICGSASISARLLESLPLPAPPRKGGKQ